MNRRSFLRSIVVIPLLAGYGLCRAAKVGVARWWHGTPGDVGQLFDHMQGAKHKIPVSMLVGMTWVKMESWHEADHLKYGDTPSSRRDYRPPRQRPKPPRVREVPQPPRVDRVPQPPSPARYAQRRQQRRRLFIVDGKLRFLYR